MLVDTLAPTTRDDLASGPPAHTDPMTVTLHASDEHGALDVSGVAVTHYRVDEGPWQTGTSVEVTGDGEHTVSYYSTDNAGNDEAVKSVNHGDDRHDAARRQQRRRSCRLDEPPGDRDAHARGAGGAHHVGARRRRHADGHQRRCRRRRPTTPATARTPITYRSWAFGDVAEPTRTAVVHIDTRGAADERRLSGRMAAAAPSP